MWTNNSNYCFTSVGRSWLWLTHMNLYYYYQFTTTSIILWPLYGTVCVTWHLQLRTEDFVRARFYCPHVLADGC